MLQSRAAADAASAWPREEDVGRGQRVIALVGRADPVPGDVSVARSLLDRADLLQLLDRAVGKRVTVISAPAGSGKTSLVRAWAARSSHPRRVAFVSVDRDEQQPERFWTG